jgi:DNA-directed RNA polymerase specialized sigma24 family protein
MVVRGSQQQLGELEALYRERWAAFARVAISIAGSVDVGKEAVQEGFARAIEEREAFRGECPLEAWVWRIVVNTAKTASVRTVREEPETILGPQDASANGHRSSEVAVWVRTLPERQPGEDFQHIGDFLHETDTPPAVRATLLRVAALIPGVKLLGTVRDHDGRSGIGFSWPSQGPYPTKGSSSELIFDPKTAELLGTQGTGPKNWTVYLQEKVVSRLPGKPPAPLEPPCTKQGGGVSHPVLGGSITNGAPLKSAKS